MVRLDVIRLEMTIVESVGVAPIAERMVKTRPRWLGRVERKVVDSVVRRVD